MLETVIFVAEITFTNIVGTKLKITPAQRHSHIKELLAKDIAFTVSELAVKFNVSEMTIHRDLNRLEKQGHIQRVHGGVLSTEKMEFEFDFANKRATNRKIKKAIAKSALTLIKPGKRLILDTGTTTLELAYLLKNFQNLTVITPSLAVASVLQFADGVETILLGGSIRHGSPDLTGAVAEHVLDMFAVDIAFQGADAIGDDGCIYNTDIRMARVDQKIRQRAAQVHILCDSSKIGSTSLATNGSLRNVDSLITDSNISKEHIEIFKKLETKITIV